MNGGERTLEKPLLGGAEASDDKPEDDVVVAVEAESKEGPAGSERAVAAPAPITQPAPTRNAKFAVAAAVLFLFSAAALTLGVPAAIEAEGGESKFTWMNTLIENIDDRLKFSTNTTAIVSLLVGLLAFSGAIYMMGRYCRPNAASEAEQVIATNPLLADGDADTGAGTAGPATATALAQHIVIADPAEGEQAKAAATAPQASDSASDGHTGDSKNAEAEAPHA